MCKDANENLFIIWQKEAKEFIGDVALFWAGKMSITIGQLITTNIENLSFYMILLKKVKEEYDREIFSRVK